MDFFNKPFEIKKSYSRRDGENDTENTGYVALEQEGSVELATGSLACQTLGKGSCLRDWDGRVNGIF